MNDSKLVIEIDAYIKNKLSVLDKERFETKMAKDPNLAQKVKQQRLHLEAIEVLLEDDLINKLEIWEKETFLFGRRELLPIILCLAIFISLGILFYKRDTSVEYSNPDSKGNPMNTPQESIENLNKDSLKVHNDTSSKKRLQLKLPNKNSEVIVENVSIPKMLLDSAKNQLLAILEEHSTRLSSESLDSFNVYNLIKNKNYGQTIKILKNNTDTKDVYILAVAYFLNNDFENSALLFDTLAIDKGFYEPDLAEYYAAISLFFNKKQIEASKRFEKIFKNKNHDYFIYAKNWKKVLNY